MSDQLKSVGGDKALTVPGGNTEDEELWWWLEVRRFCYGGVYGSRGWGAGGVGGGAPVGVDGGSTPGAAGAWPPAPSRQEA